MNKYSKLFSSLLVVLLMLDIATPALTYAATADLVEEANEAEEVITSEVTGEETVTEKATPAIKPAEEKTEDADQSVVDTPAVVEEQTHPTTQTDAEKLQEENEVTREAMQVAEEEVREAQAGGNYIPVNITHTNIVGDKSVFDNGDEIGIYMDWNITPGTSVQSGDYFTVSYPYFLEAVKSSFAMNHGTCEASNGLVKCTFDDRVNNLDNIHGGLEFGGKLVVEKGTGEQTVSLTVNGQLVKDIVLDGGSNEVGGVINQLVDKMGTRADDKHLNWIITLNGDQSANTIKLTDRPNQGHKIIPESIVVSVNGTSFSYNELSGSGVVRSHSITPEQIYLELQLGGQLAAVSYQTEIVSEDVKEWSNTVSVSATTHYGEVQESESAKVEKFGGAWSQGELAKYRGSFTVVKTDEAGTPLQGATFNLKDNEGKVVQTFTTDENGQATIADIAGGHYTLVETAAPVGYVLNEEAMDVMLKFDQEKSFTKEVVNKKAEAPKTCENFTVNTEDGATVTITDSEGKEFATGTAENGKFTTDKPLEVGKYYEVTVAKEGYETKTEVVTGSEDNCETTVQLTKTPEETCENFTVNTEDGATVTITDSGGKEFAKGTAENGKFTTNKPLEVGKDYTVTVDKEGYETAIQDVKGSKDECEVTVELKEKQVCSNFTVTVKDNDELVNDATVKIIEQENSKEVATGQTGGKGAAGNEKPVGQFVTSPLDQGKTYIVVVEKDGYKTVTQEITVDKNCGMEINISKEETPKEEVCENFTVYVADKNKGHLTDAIVTIKDSNGSVVLDQQETTDGKVVTEKPLNVDEKYTVIVEKDGYETVTLEVTGSKDDCFTTVELTEVPTEEVCKDFTVHVADKDTGLPVDATVTIKDVEGNEIEGSMTNGKFVTESPLEPGKEYKVTVKADGYEEVTKTVYGPKDNCFTIVEVVKEAETCNNFTVNVKVDGNKEEGATVVITGGDLTEEKLEGKTNENGQFTTTKPLTKGETYEVTVTTKDGQVKTETITIDDNCDMTVSFTTTPKEEVCEDFTVVTEEGATVTITDSEGKEFAKGTVEDGKFVTERPLEVNKDYTVIVEKEGFATKTETVTGAEDNCEVTVDLVRESGTLPPTEPEETPGEVVTPENPDEGQGGETPELPETPGTETPEAPEEKPSTGGGGGGGTTTPETPELPEEPETPETPETPENPGEGEETPELPETPGAETPENTKATVGLVKVDAKNVNKVLAGATFDLYKKDGNVLVAEGLVTNDEGLIKVTDLEAGEYYFVERRAPKGYKLNREKQFVKATVGTESMITVENKKRPTGGGGGGGSTTPTEPETPTTPEGEGGETPETPEEPETPSETPGEGEEAPETPEGTTPETPENPGEGEETPTTPEGEPETPSETPEGTETDDTKDETPIIKDRPDNNNSTVDSDKRPTTNTDSTQKVEQEKPAVEKGNVLPQTGEATNMFVLFLAGLLIATGSVLVIRRRTA